MPKKDILRVCVGSWDGPKSSIWNIIGNSSDLYLNPGPLMKERKLSIHASGQRIYAFLDDDKAEAARCRSGFPEPTRRIVEWMQPTEEVASGFVHELSVCIPTSDLSGYAGVTTKEKIQWISAPPIGYATEIMVIMPTKAQSPKDDGSADILPPLFSNCWRIGPGFIGYQYVPISAALQTSIDECRQMIREPASSINDPKSWRAISAPTQVNDDSLRIMYDLCPIELSKAD